MIGQVLRILQFETPVADADIDRLLRDEIAPRPADLDGLSWTVIGRHLSETSRSYLVATVWDDRAAMEAAVLSGGVAVYQAPFAPYLANARLTAVDVVDEWSSCPSGPLSRILLILDDGSGMTDGPNGSVDLDPVTLSDATQPPCLILAGAAEAGRPLLAGWPAGRPAVAVSPIPARANALLDRIQRLSGAGLASEYAVVADRGLRPTT